MQRYGQDIWLRGTFCKVNKPINGPSSLPVVKQLKSPLCKSRYFTFHGYIDNIIIIDQFSLVTFVVGLYSFGHDCTYLTLIMAAVSI